MCSAKVVTFTMNPAVDLFGETAQIFDDSKSRCQQNALVPGGGGINVARNMRRMGSDTVAVFPAGGPNGQYLTQLLDNDGQTYEAVPIAAHTRQNFAITDKQRNVMHHFVFPGPQVTESELRACRQNLLKHQANLVVLSGSLGDDIPQDFYAKITEEANGQGSKVLLDTSGGALSESLYSGAYLAKLNRKEFASLGFDENAPIAELITQMQSLVERDAVEVLIVTLNRGGAVMVSQQYDPLYISAPQVHIVSHVGAGDSFMSALAHYLNQGESLPTAFRYGVAAAYVTVQCAGNQLEDLEWLQRAFDEVREETL